MPKMQAIMVRRFIEPLGQAGLGWSSSSSNQGSTVDGWTQPLMSRCSAIVSQRRHWCQLEGGGRMTFTQRHPIVLAPHYGHACRPAIMRYGATTPAT
ncbi:hypothetical protein Sinac_4996 [Singulisphaera acidiphila DSM 18658]|uniref:Uncharacterized protein n=1 Tax=Singulisphaera acidiphila (strain ATCC BAA-1392 / DSM 18658 / VKM B-2454 / MOB10) TaxID=886293 RepID=L0DKG3_SINAD|nr:hypothetical protein Sinac_4996 [Singulisphaera acidiphila DSM 18658]